MNEDVRMWQYNLILYSTVYRVAHQKCRASAQYSTLILLNDIFFLGRIFDIFFLGLLSDIFFLGRGLFFPGRDIFFLGHPVYICLRPYLIRVVSDFLST